jgi:HlyD family secretion protein
MTFRSKTAAAILGIVAIGGGVSYWTLARDKSSQSQFTKATVERGTIRITVRATGSLEAVRTVQVGSQISGQIAALHADYNSNVKKGQLLAEIDPRTFQSQVLTEEAQNASSQARLQSAQSDLINQEANLVSVQANLRVTQVASDNAQLLFERAKQSMQKGLVAQNDYDTAKSNAESAAAKVDQAAAAIKQAEAQIRSKQASIEQAKSDIISAKASLDRAKINLDLTKIYSPVDGVVISRNVDIGQTVAASLSAPTLFVIANDLTRMQVKANIDEADIGKITPDVRVSFSVDAYPNDTFTGNISEVRLEPQTVQNVVTYSVIVGVDNSQLKLKPGMTANLTLTVDEHPNVLTVPNAALRFTPTGMTQDQIAKLIQDLPLVPPPQAAEGGDRGAGEQASGDRGAGQPTAKNGNAQTGDQRRGNRGGGNGGGFGGRRGQGGQGGQGAQAGGGGNAFRGGAGGGAGAFPRNNGGGGGGFRGNASGNSGFAAGGGRGGRGGGQGRRTVLWYQDATGALKPTPVRTGLNDGTRTEVFGPDLKEGMSIITSDLSQTTTNQQRPANTNPLLPQQGFPGGGGGNRGGRGF